jgi:streptogramin lyase
VKLTGAALWAIVVLSTSVTGLDARQQAKTAAVIGTENIAGVVTSSKGAEAGVWVIAETTELPTKFTKIVVTDDEGRYLLPDLPKANYNVWVRGYGLVDSKPVHAKPGDALNLTAVIAPDERAAAEIYPATYWLALMRLPPGKLPPFEVSREVKQCMGCHQLGDKWTREIPSWVGKVNSTQEGWDHRITGGAQAPLMSEIFFGRLGLQRTMFADWSDRITAGALPELKPSRPSGIERNLVVSLWDWGGSTDYMHDAAASDKRDPTANANGLVYGTTQSRDVISYVDPVHNKAGEIPIPTIATPIAEPASGSWGGEVIRRGAAAARSGAVDAKGRAWFAARFHDANLPDFCKPGASNEFTQYYAIQNTKSQRTLVGPTNTTSPGNKQVAFYDPRTGKITPIETCFTPDHNDFSDDGSLFFGQDNAVGWVNTEVYDKTHDDQASQGWCPAVLDTNGDGKITEWTEPDQPIDPTKDHRINFGCYGIGVQPDGTVWCSPGGEHSNQIVRIERGSHPPRTCKGEVYQAPKESGIHGSRGVAVDSNGVAWVNFIASDLIASFDRRKCKVLNGPTATGQHCPEGWTYYPIPGPNFQGSNLRADSTYLVTVDKLGILGLGKDVVMTESDQSDSLLALLPKTGQWVRLQVPYPRGFLARAIDWRVDDPKTGWRGKGTWSNYASMAQWHSETGQGNKGKLVKFQLRPDPLAK